MLAPRSSRFVIRAGALCTVVACGASSGSHGRAGAAPGDPGVPEPAPTGPGTASNGAAGGDGASSGGDDEPPFVPYQAFDVNHVISTGQSNSVAHEGRPVLTTAQPFSNLMFEVGVMTSGDCDDDGCMSYQKPTSFA